MQKKIILLLSLICCLSAGSVVWAQNVNLQKGIEAFQNGNYSEAITILSEETERNSQFREPYIFLAAAYLEQDFPVLAEHTADEGLEHFENEAGFLWLKAEALFRQRLPHEARDIYRKLFREYESLTFSEVMGINNQRIRNRWIESELTISSMAYQAGNFDEATEALETILRLDSSHLQAIKNRIYLFMEQEEWEQVIEYSEAALEEFPGDADIIRMKASAHYHVEDSEALLEEYEKLYEQDPLDVDTAIIYAEILLANQRGGDAEMVLAKLLEQYPENKRVYQEFAKLHERRMYFSAKASVLELMLEQYPDDEDVYLDLAETYEIEQEWEKAREVYKKLGEISDNQAEISRSIAQTYIEEDNLRAAEQILYKALQEHPDNIATIILLGDILQEQEKWEASLDILKRLPVELQESVPGIKTGLAYFQLKDFGRSEDILKKITDNGINEPQAWLLYAKLVHSDDPQQALEWLARAVKQSFQKLSQQQSVIQEDLHERRDFNQAASVKSSIEYYNDMAEQSVEFLFDNFSRRDVEPHVDELISTYQESPDFLDRAAEFYIKHQDFERAKVLLRQALELDSSLFEAHYRMGDLLEQEMNYSEAALFYERALGADPESDKTYKAIIRVYDRQEKKNELADKWKVRYRAERENKQLLEYLIEILHKADRFEEAAELLSH